MTITNHPTLSSVKTYKINKEGPGSYSIGFVLEDGRAFSAEYFPTEYKAREYAALFCNLRH